MLAGLVQNPDSNNPVRNPSAALDRRDVVINRMVELKLITLDQAKEAKQTGFDQKVKKNRRSSARATRSCATTCDVRCSTRPAWVRPRMTART